MEQLILTNLGFFGAKEPSIASIIFVNKKEGKNGLRNLSEYFLCYIFQVDN